MSDFAEQEHLALTEEGVLVVRATGERLGFVKRPETCDRVPDEPQRKWEYHWLLGLWEDAEAFGEACRDQAEWEYNTSRGVG